MSRTVTTAGDCPPRRKRGRSLWADARRRIFRDWSAVVCMIVIALFILIALGALTYDLLGEHVKSVKPFKDQTNYNETNLPPSLKSPWYWLGTDWAGKSILVKTIMGAKASLTVGLMANVIAVPLGMVLGALAGYYRGWIDTIVVWLFSTLASVPGIILLIAIKYAFKGKTVLGLELDGIHGLYIALGVISWVGTCRLVRAEVMKTRELDYVMAARATGTPGIVILFRHIIPNVMHLAIISFSLGTVGAIKAEVMLSFLGLGVKPETPSWGSMINAARMDLFNGRWWELTAAVTAMFFLILALSIFGDRLRDALDPRLKNV